jgi:hypothetical protein
LKDKKKKPVEKPSTFRIFTEIKNQKDFEKLCFNVPACAIAILPVVKGVSRKNINLIF